MGCRKRAGRTLGLGCLGLIVLTILFFKFTQLGHDVVVAWRHGIIQGALSKDDDRKYNATSTGNLKALYIALDLYHASEGKFPEGNGWMDAIQNRIKAGDMNATEANKKLVSPSLAGQSGKYGYAINNAAAGKYKGDIKDKSTVLIFDSSDTSRNAHGDPKVLLPKPPRPGGNLGITVDGTIVKL